MPLISEAATAEVSVVGHELPRRAGVGGGLLDVVDGADVVQSSAGDQISLGRLERAGHDPRRAERDGRDLVGREGVPYDELSVLRGGDQGLGVRGPVHGVDLAEVTPQRPAHFNRLADLPQRALRLGHRPHGAVPLLFPHIGNLVLEAGHLLLRGFYPGVHG